MANNKQIKATLVLSEGNFFTNIKKAASGLKGLKSNFDNNSKSIKNHASALASTGSSLGSLAKKVAGVAAAYVSINKIVSVTKECIEKAKTAEQANVRLNTIMQQIPGITQEAKDGVAAYCKELSKQTSIGGTAQKMGASQLASFKMSADSVKKLMPSLNNLAVAQYGVNVSGDQMIQAANMLGKAYSGQTGALTRAGVVLSETQAKTIKNGTDAQKTAALVEVLTQNFGDLAAQMANTKEGQIIRIKNAIGGIKTTIGNKLLPVIATVTEYIADKIPTIQSTIENVVDNVTPIAQKAVGGIKKGFEILGNTISWVKDNWARLAPVIGAVVGAITAYKTAVAIATAVQWAMNAAISANPIGLIVTAIGAVIGGIFVLYKRCEGFKNVVNTAFSAILSAAKYVWAQIKIVWDAVKPYFSALWKGIKAYAEVYFTYLKGYFKTAWEVIKVYLGAAFGYFKSVWESIKLIFSVVKSVFTGDFQGAWDGIKAIVGVWKDYFSGVWNGIKNIFGAVGEWFGSTFSVAKEKICGAFSEVGNFVKSIWDGIIKTIKGAINLIIKGINSMLSGAVGKINDLIDGINSVSGVVGIPAIPHLPVPQIPMLARGGVIRRGGNVIVGERGPEMLSLPRGARVFPLPAGATGGGNTYTNTFYVTVNADDEGSAERFVEKVKKILDNM